jgi:hypothetical protein
VCLGGGVCARACTWAVVGGLCVMCVWEGCRAGAGGTWADRFVIGGWGWLRGRSRGPAAGAGVRQERAAGRAGPRQAPQVRAQDTAHTLHYTQPPSCSQARAIQRTQRTQRPSNSEARMCTHCPPHTHHPQSRARAHNAHSTPSAPIVLD